MKDYLCNTHVNKQIFRSHHPDDGYIYGRYRQQYR